MTIGKKLKIIKELESQSNSDKANTVIRHNSDDEEQQLSLMPSPDGLIAEKLKSTDINTLTPIEAMNLLYELKKMI